MRLEKKVAVITGGANGIGRAIALGYAKEGATVVIADIDKKGADAVVSEITAAGGKALAVECNVAIQQQVKDLATTVVETFGAYDILVNSAAEFKKVDLLKCSVEEWDHTMDVNLKGTFFNVQEACRYMKEHGGGAIINLTSSAAFRGRPGQQAFSASKGGLRGLTGNVCVQMGEYGIRINNLCPGWIDGTNSEELARDNELLRDFRTKAIPLQRVGTPEDLVGPAIFLASSDAAYVTGETLIVDGGASVELSGIGDHVKSDY